MLNHIHRDLIKKHIGPFLLCFFTMMFILLMQFLILHVDKLVGKGLPLGVVIELILNNLAYMVVLALPISVLLSTLIAFGKFSEWNELTAIRAAGVNPIKLMIPILFLGFIMFLFTGYFSNDILPESNHKARSLFIDIRTQKPAFDLQPSTFYDNIEGFTFLIKDIDSETDSLYDIRIVQEPTQDRNRAFINAERGWLESPDELTLSLFLVDGSILRYIPGTRGQEETLEKNAFSKYRMSFDLSDLSFSRSNPEQRGRTDRTMSAQAMIAVIDTLKRDQQNEIDKFYDILSRDEHLPFHFEESQIFELQSGTLADTAGTYNSSFVMLANLPNPEVQRAVANRSISALDRYRPELESLQTNLEWRDFRIAEYWVEVHKKLSIPFACVIFVLVGAPLGILTRKGNIGVAAVISAILLTIYFISVIQGEKLADRMMISPFWGMWGINLFYLMIGILLTLHVSTSLQITRLFRKK